MYVRMFVALFGVYRLDVSVRGKVTSRC